VIRDRNKVDEGNTGAKLELDRLGCRLNLKMMQDIVRGVHQEGIIIEAHRQDRVLQPFDVKNISKVQIQIPGIQVDLSARYQPATPSSIDTH
jgi:hypothetical protein